MKKLTRKEELFCREYMVDLNGKHAAIRAGYSEKTAITIASNMLVKPHVAARVQELMNARAEKTAITSERVLTEIFRLATVDIGQAYDDAGYIKPIHEIPEDVRRAIAAIEVNELFDGGQGDQKTAIGFTKKIKFTDKTKALELLGKHLKLFTEKHEHSGDGFRIVIEDYKAEKKA